MGIVLVRVCIPLVPNGTGIGMAFPFSRWRLSLRHPSRAGHNIIAGCVWRFRILHPRMVEGKTRRRKPTRLHPRTARGGHSRILHRRRPATQPVGKTRHFRKGICSSVVHEQTVVFCDRRTSALRVIFVMQSLFVSLTMGDLHQLHVVQTSLAKAV